MPSTEKVQRTYWGKIFILKVKAILHVLKKSLFDHKKKYAATGK